MMRSLLLMLLMIAASTVFAQQPDIENYLGAIQNGKAEEVRAELPSLLRQYPNNPGVLYVQAMLTTDGAEAVRLYQDLVDKYPSSEWADDALYKVYKFYSAIGLNRTAGIKLSQLRTSYPDSKYLLAEGVSPGDTIQHALTAEATPPIPTVEKEIVTPKREVPPVVAQPAGKYSLQVGVYSTVANAGKQKKFFEYQNYVAEIGSKMKGSRELFVVYVGNYATENEARVKGEEIKRVFNIENLVVTR